MVPIYPASTADQAGYVIEHGDVRVLFVDTEALLARVIEALAHDAGRAPHRPARRRARRRPLAGVVERARPRGPALRRRGAAGDPLRARARRRRGQGPRGADRVRAHAGRSRPRSAGGDALHERHQRPAQGRPAHPPQRGCQRRGLAALQRASDRRGRGRSLVAALQPHLRLRRGLPRQHPGLDELHGRPAAGHGRAARRAAARVHERAERVGEAGDPGDAEGDAGRPAEGAPRADGRAPPLLPVGRGGAQAGGEGALPRRAGCSWSRATA